MVGGEIPNKDGSIKKGGVYCSFCGGHNTERSKLILGPRVAICNECLMLCICILKEELIDWPNIDVLSASLASDTSKITLDGDALDVKYALYNIPPERLKGIKFLVVLKDTTVMGTCTEASEEGIILTSDEKILEKMEE